MALTSLGGGSDAVSLEAGAITKVESDMSLAITNLRNSVNAINDAAQAARSGWKGDANDKFNQVAQAWEDEAEALNRKLDALTEAVNSGKTTIQTMDQA